jgi:multidrug efflux pump subunit AcrB
MSGFNLSSYAVRQPAVTLFLIIATLLAGVIAFGKLGRAEDPSFTVKTMTITAAWPGATAREMQEQVADRLEKRLQELDLYDRVETIAQPGFVSMRLQFLDSTRPKDIQQLFYQTRKKLTDEAQRLPRGVLGPYFNDEYSDVYFALYALEAEPLPHRQQVRMAEDLRQQLLRLPGVKKVNILGEQAPRIFVEFSYERLATLGLRPEQIFDSLAKQNAVAPAGFVETSGPRAHIRLDGAFDSLELIENVPINAGGRLLRIADVANVRRGYEEPASYRIRHQGKPALMLGVVMEPHFNGLELDESLQAEESRIQADLPLGIRFDKVADQAEKIRLAVNEFMLKFFVALAVVMVISLLALGLRVGLVVAAAVPLTLSIVFVVMLATGREFDRITLGALILSLGLLVDDAIIAIEMMVVKLEEGLGRMQAATFAWTSTAAPMLTGTLVTVIGFLPVGFARSGAGEYAGNIFWIVGFALLASWLVAVFFTPYLGVKLLPKIRPVAGGHEALYATPGYQRLRRVVSWCVNRRVLVSVLVVGAFALSILGLGAVKKQFFPNSDRSELLVEVYMPPGSAFKATEAVVAQVEQALLEEPQTQMVDAYVGGGAPRFFLSLNPELPDPAFAKLIVQTADSHARDALKARMQARVEAGEFPSARVRVTQLVFGPPVPFPVVFRVSGPDLERLRQVSEEVRAVVSTNPMTRDTFVDWGERSSAYRLVLDQDRLRLLGFSLDEVKSQLNALLVGNPVTEVREGTRSVSVMVRALNTQRENLDGIAGLTITNAAGVSVPLEQVGHFQAVMEEPILKRRDREPTFEVRADILPGTQPPDVQKAVYADLQALIAGLPEGYRVTIGGPVEESAKANRALAEWFPLMILLTLVVIMFQVRSFALMFMVFATAPLGLIGAVPTLLLFGQPFGFNAILALIGIGGILMRNTLIFTDQIRHEQADGRPLREAIIEATVRRARPVLLTALAAALAFIPLTFSVFWSAMAYVLIGGVLVGTLLTLLFLPALAALILRTKPQPTREAPPSWTPSGQTQARALRQREGSEA